jgi:hypothetical protein
MAASQNQAVSPCIDEWLQSSSQLIARHGGWRG